MAVASAAATWVVVLAAVFTGGGFGGGGFGGFGGRSMATGGFNRGFGFNRSFAGVNHGMFAGRSVAMGGFDRGLGFNRGFNRFGFNRGFNSRFARFDRFHHFHHFHHFRNRFAFVGGGWDWGYPNYDYAAYGDWVLAPSMDSIRLAVE
jgi:hypothetical protein